MIVGKRFVLLVFTTAFLTGYLGRGVINHIFGQLLTVGHPPETTSEFFKTYLPEEIVRRFDSKHQVGSVVGRNGGTASFDHRFARKSANVSLFFFMKREDRCAFMPALRDYTSNALKLSGARIVETSGGDCDGFALRYRVGKIEGLVRVDPSETRIQPFLDELRADVHLVIEETWDKLAIPEPTTVAVSQ